MIALAAKHFQQLPENSKRALLGKDWWAVRSPGILPALRREAEAGNARALGRWLELDPVAVTAFARKEVVRPVPRFSSFSLKLPEGSLPEQERRIALNFIALAQVPDRSEEQEKGLNNAATLLHQYATKKVLSIVLPVIDAELNDLPCPTQLATLAYLIKVSLTDAAQRVEKTLQPIEGDSCSSRSLTILGLLQPSPLLEKLAVKHIQAGDDLGEDAAHYLQLYGAAQMKPVLWEQLVLWHEKLVESETVNGAKALKEPSRDRSKCDEMVRGLGEAYGSAK